MRSVGLLLRPKLPPLFTLPKPWGHDLDLTQAETALKLRIARPVPGKAGRPGNLQKRVRYVVGESGSPAPAHVRRNHGTDLRGCLGDWRPAPRRLPIGPAVALPA